MPPKFPRFQIKESPEGDWNIFEALNPGDVIKSFKLKNPRKGTETVIHWLSPLFYI